MDGHGADASRHGEEIAGGDAREVDSALKRPDGALSDGPRLGRAGNPREGRVLSTTGRAEAPHHGHGPGRGRPRELLRAAKGGEQGRGARGQRPWSREGAQSRCPDDREGTSRGACRPWEAPVSMGGGAQWRKGTCSRSDQRRSLRDTTTPLNNTLQPQVILHQLKDNQHHHQPKSLMDQLHVAELRSYSKRCTRYFMNFN
jgi:hypothetical protein